MPSTSPVSSPGTPASRQHSHVFDQGNPLAERNTRLAVLLTLVTMVVEIAGGWYYHSMALLADGWHMGSHVLALGLAAGAYAAARRWAGDRRFNFGTWKIEVLGSYTSAILLLLVAAAMVVQSGERLLTPARIHYDQAIAIGVVGLLVNLACAWLLRGGHAHGHHHGEHGHGHAHHGHDHAAHAHGHADLNLRAAYLHVVADAATSVLAIAALFGGKLWGADWLDPAVGLAGSVLVGSWAIGLLRTSGRVLIDAEMDAPVVQEIREALADGPVPVRIDDLHVWRVGKGSYACILCLTADGPLSADDVRRLLSVHEEIVHVSVEINPALAPTPV